MRDKERRANKRFKMKENKKHPYKRRWKLSFETYEDFLRSKHQEKFAIVDSEGGVIEKFRSLVVAKDFLRKMHSFPDELKIVDIDEIKN